jgi:hypothetical protein
MKSKHGWHRWIATAIVVSALGAPVASASPVDGPGTSPALKAYQERLKAEQASQPAPVVTPSVTRSSDAFDWGDAGIGAAATFALGAIAAGGLLTVGAGRRHLRRTA